MFKNLSLKTFEKHIRVLIRKGIFTDPIGKCMCSGRNSQKMTEKYPTMDKIVHKCNLQMQSSKKKQNLETHSIF